MSKEKDEIKKSSQPNSKKGKSVPDYGRPKRREIGWNEDKDKL